ncbi:threonine ammonia-lyase [Carboxylicivirga sediminis]|uniref:L-threonine dehydratase n=1 Tax=Carboxylicivirga sediminis TaxID=2006564 RepID=A0A941F1R1_9BACT|nr:threonine ammonia-lyase [Carboxylicivirga sediminis]MBR8534772.1 threonine ammonia-lyase [Carboxylicivirga sediminis]
MTTKNGIAAFKDYYPTLEAVRQAKKTISEVVETTPLMRNFNLSEQYCSNIYLKREDLQTVRSYKIRGAYNKIKSLTKQQVSSGIVCASAGNHAQGVAYSCKKLGINGFIYMPTTTPKQKVNQVKMFGKGYVEVVLKGDTYDDAYNAAMEECSRTGRTFIHPFDDPQIIEGQATVGLEILEQTDKPIDYIFVPIGGGGLISGLGAYIKQITPDTKIIGVEPAGAPAMQQSMEKGEVVELEEIDKFVDGAAVQKVGNITLPICRRVMDDLILVPEGKICTKILELYNYEAIVVEPAGALSIAALDFYAEQIIGKNVVCILSGSNNDITRTEEIRERSLLYEGLKHYFIVRFPQRAGALKTFVDKVLGPGDDITHFEYKKKTARAMGPVVIGVEVQKPEDFEGLQKRMAENGFVAEYLNEKPDLFQYLI